MTSPEAKLQALVDSGAVTLEGRPHGGTGRGMATLGGQRYAYPGGGKVSKTLAAAVEAAHSDRTRVASAIQRAVRRRVLRPGAPQASAGQAERETSARRRRGAEVIQRAVRRRVLNPRAEGPPAKGRASSRPKVAPPLRGGWGGAPQEAREVKARNAYVHKLVAGLESINRGQAEKLDIDLKEVKAKVLRQLIVKNVVSGKRLALRLPTGEMFFLNDRNLQRLADGVVEQTWRTDRDNYGELMRLDEAGDSLELVVIPEGRKRPAGGFFGWTHRTTFDWSRYGIFAEVDPANYHENCLWLALKAAGLAEDKLARLKLMVVNRVVAKCKLSEVCAALEISIRLKSVIAGAKTPSKQERYGDPAAPTYQLGLYSEHYFLIAPVKVTSFALLNYNEVKDLPDFQAIYKKDGQRYRRDEGRYIDSYRLFELLLANRDALLEPITYCEAIQASQFYDRVTEFGSLEFSEKCLRAQEYKAKGQGPAPYKAWFDFETTTNGERHEPYLARFETQDGQQREFRGRWCGLAMLQAIARLDQEEVRLIAHNSNYDCRFLLAHLSKQRVVDKSGRFLSVDGLFEDQDTGRRVKLSIRDSYRMIDMPLRDFGKSFGLPIEKEVLPYSLFTQATVGLETVPLAEALSHVEVEDRPQFLENADKWGCIDGDQFRHIDYSSHYCRLDCSVLRQGWETFRGWLLEHTGLDPDHYLTLQSLAADFMVKEGCFEGVPQLSGVPQAFISRCVVGGRVGSNGGRKYHLRGRKTQDVDACSLYPSAMKRLGGYLLGSPKVLAADQLDYGFLCRQDGYFVDIRVTGVGKRRQFPLASVVRKETGCRDWTNDLEGQVLHMDKIGLEDLIRWQGVTFEVLRGYYYNEGRSDRLGVTIQRLYDLRRQLKKDKNPAQLVFKLLMNSAYGRTILKPIETDTIVVPEDRWESYQSLNYNFLERAQKVGNKYYVKRIKSIAEHFNSAQAGVEVLSMSKRIMSEVMVLAQDIGETVLYQDCDSMHIDAAAVPKLAAAFEREYGRPLIGDEAMGEFHCDFSLPGACGEIYATETIVLGKKCYLDILESVDKDGCRITGEHVRMKGVPTASIRHAAEREGISVRDLYLRLHNGEAINFDLTCGGRACGFKYQRDLSVRSYKEGEFSRRICFPN